MSELDNFVSAVKEKRDETLKLIGDRMENQCGQYEMDDAILDIDKLIGGVLDVVEERYADLVTGSAQDSEGEEVSVELSIITGLSTLYFEEVAS